MFSTRIKAVVRKNLPDLRALLSGNYPGFVFGKGLVPDKDSVPVFVFHDVDSGTFERKLSFLKDNGYQTLNASEWLTIISSPTADVTKRVMLTFDDGHISLYDFAFPLLKKYCFQAVSFICPGLVPDNQSAGATSENSTLCSWTQIREMHASGHVDFQSHSLKHDLVFSTSTCVDFFNPHFRSHYLGKTDRLVMLQDGPYVSLTSLWPYEQLPYSDEFWGYPIYRLSPLHSATSLYRPSDRLVSRLTNLVRENSGKRFFSDPGWKSKLKREMSVFSSGNAGAYIPQETFRDWIIHDFNSSKEIIEEGLPGKNVQHFCAPWYEASGVSADLAFKCGYKTLFLGEDAYPWNSSGIQRDTVLKVPRISEKYIFCLPGAGRKNLVDIIGSELQQNLGLSRKQPHI